MKLTVSSSTTKKALVTLLAVALLPASYFSTLGNAPISERSGETRATSKITRPSIDVHALGTIKARALIKGLGEVRAVHRLELAMEVGGRVTWSSPSLTAGAFVKTGQVLLEIETAALEVALADAKRAQAEARIALLEEKQRAEQAKQDWLQADLEGTPTSPLLLRRPQLEAAELRLQATKADVKQAEVNLKKATVSTPFDAIVERSTVAPGAILSAGSVVAALYSVDQFEVEVTFSEQDLGLLPKDTFWRGAQRESDLDLDTRIRANGESWRGAISRPGPVVDPASRQRSLIIEIDEDSNADSVLMPGVFVSVEIEGGAIPDLLALPASTITTSGWFWGVTDAGRLEKHAADVVFARGEHVFVKTPDSSRDRWLIVANPLPRLLPGLEVDAVEVGNAAIQAAEKIHE